MLVNPNVIENFILHELDGDKVVIGKLLSFLKNYTDEISKIELYSDKVDVAHLIFLAHKCRSICKSFGCEELYSLLVDVEVYGKKNDIARMLNSFTKAKEVASASYAEVNNFILMTFERR